MRTANFGNENDNDQRHLRQSELLSQEPGYFKCIICGNVYKKEISLYAHITSHSEDILSGTCNAQSNVGYVIETDNKSKTYNCKSCEFSTSALIIMQAHIRGHLEGSHTNKENHSPADYFTLSGTSYNFAMPENEKNKYEYSEDGRDWSGKEAFDEQIDDNGFGCDSCCTRYKDKDSLKAHIWDNHIPKKLDYKCDICGKVYSVSSHLQQHMTISHGKDVADDSDSSEKNSNQYQNSKLQKSKTKSHSCQLCDASFPTKEELESHGAVHTGDKSYECNTCKKRFSSKKYLFFHLKGHVAGLGKRKGRSKISEDLDYLKQEAQENGKASGDSIRRTSKRKRLKLEKPFKCDEENCQYATSQYSLLKTHKFKHNPFYICVTCQEKFPTRSELKNHMSTHGDRPFKCDQCNKCYKDRHGLGWHKKVQHDPSRLKFTCELCGKTYPYDSLLTQHIHLTHAAEKQSVCDICGKNVSKTYLPMHRRTHGEKQFSCDICEKTFLEKAYLKRHKMVHTGEKPYVCSVCGNSFRQHSTLTIHMRTHTGDRPYKCVLCENAYKTHHNLKKHYKRTGHKVV